MKNIKMLIAVAVIGIISLMSSCEDFLEVETPNDKLDSNTVFATDQTALSALQGIFNQLFNVGFFNGGSQSVSFTGGLYADTYTLTSTTQDLVEFQQNQISPDNNINLNLWSGAYNIIYQANAVLKGVKDNNSLSTSVMDQLEGSSKFIRAFTYFNLLNLYGEVPLILHTDYEENSLASRSSINLIYTQILQDLEDAETLLDENYLNGERTHLNRYAVQALLARVHLYLENWQEAEAYSSLIIEASAYEVLNDLNEVFLANSPEAIWQISPIGWGNSFTHTREGNLLVKTPTSNTPVILSEDLLNSFSSGEDKRLKEWVDYFINGTDTLYYPYKYKIQFDSSGGSIIEYSTVLRLAEQYLIRAEAQARMGNIEDAIEDLNVIKSRAGEPLIGSSENSMTVNDLLEEILLERRREFFSEWAHRWMDLKRFDRTDVLQDKENSNWTNSSTLFPIPFEERMKNPNLTQNPGY